MAVVRYAGDRYTGLSTDPKPTDILEGAVFLETDTAKSYFYDGSSWTLITADADDPLGFLDLTDPGADRIAFWDDSAGAVAWMSWSTDDFFLSPTGELSAGGNIAQFDASGTIDATWQLGSTGVFDINNGELKLDSGGAFTISGSGEITFDEGSGIATLDAIYDGARVRPRWASQNIAYLADPGADRLLMWDESASGGGHWAGCSLGAGLGLTGTTLALDVSSLPLATSNADTHDQFIVWDDIDQVHRKMEFADLSEGLSITESQITDLGSYALEARTITAGTGLSGGGDLTADRTINIDFTGVSLATAVADANDQFLVWDSIDDVYRRLEFADLNDGMSLTASQIASGTFDDARIAQSSVTQHEAALTITESQISDLGNYPEKNVSEYITGGWTFSLVLAVTGEFRLYNGINYAVLSTSLLTASRTHTLPNANGTLALTSDIPSTSDLLPKTASVTSVGTGTGTTTIGNSQTGNVYYATTSIFSTRSFRLDSATVGTQIEVHRNGAGTVQFTQGTSQTIIQGNNWEMADGSAAKAICVATNTWSVVGEQA